LGGSFGSIPDLPADFAPGSSSYSIDALFTIEFRVIAEIFSDFRKPGAGAFFSASSSFCLRQLILGPEVVRHIGVEFSNMINL